MQKLIEKCRQNMRNGIEPLAESNESECEQLMKRYSCFADKYDATGMLIDSQLQITALQTPRPYLHLMASNHYDNYDQWGSFWDQRRGGFCCVDTVLAGKMSSHLDTNYVPTSPKPTDNRDFFIHEQGKAYPMFPVPDFEEDCYNEFQCDLGLDTYTLTANRNKLKSVLEVFVHPAMPLEVWQITLTNNSKNRRNISWFSRIKVNIDSFPFYYFEPRVVCKGEFESDNIMVFTNADGNNKNPRAAFFAADSEFDGYDMMEEIFDNSCGRAPLPTAVQQGKCFNSLGIQPHAGLIAATQFNTELAPGESKNWTIVYGKAPADSTERANYLNRVKSEVINRTTEIKAELASIWHRKVTANAITTPNKELNRYFNIWSKYQARNQARFIRALDKIGYRDILQDIMGVIDFEPEYVKAKLAEALQYQFDDGTAVRQYEKIPHTGHDLRMYQDSPVWIIDTLTGYLKQSGDMAFLNLQVPWLDRETLQPSATATASIYQHAKQAVHSLFTKTGHFGLCAIGYGDWNDAISGIGGKQGVSVWLSCACVYAANLMHELAICIDKKNDAEEFANIAATMTERINQHAWNGSWYIYAFNDQGNPIGADECNEGKIHLNVNTWAIFTGIATAADRTAIVWKAIEQLNTPVGHRLLMPPYTAISRSEVGRIADQLPGMFENGSIYTHGESFFLYALITEGKSDVWLQNIIKTLPACQVPDIATGPPHQQSNFFTGPDHPDFGSNLYSNFTGSLAWYRKGIEKIIGLIPEYNGLRIAPQVPKCWKEYSVMRRFRGAEISFSYQIAANKSALITINGKKLDEPFIPTAMLQPDHYYEVICYGIPTVN